LISDDPKKAYDLALDLDRYNKERKSIELLLSEEVNNQVKDFQNDPVLVLSGDNWHEGIIGIVAARIKDKYNKPTILISLTNNIGKGSARSVIGFDIGGNIIKATQLNIIKKGGGHKMAAGFTVEKTKISELRDFLIKNFQKSRSSSLQDVNLYLDTVIAPSALNEDFYKEINTLGPFGSGNNEPKFVIENLQVIAYHLVGESHIKSVLLGKDGTVFKSLTWNGKNTPLEPFLKKENKKKINIAGKMKLNQWKGKNDIEFVIEDISVN
jgi:single-stranded-DNA-specific exonuclease